MSKNPLRTSPVVNPVYKKTNEPAKKWRGKALMTLSPDGFVTDPVKKMDFLLAHFFLADAGKSYLNPNTTNNIQDLYARFKNNPDAFVSELRQVLHDYFQLHYQQAHVTVFNQTKENEEPQNGQTIVVRISVTENGKTYSTDKLVTHRESRFINIINYYQTGELP